MGSQAINFEGQTYNFPSDAKDEEILNFLHSQPGELSKRNDMQMRHGASTLMPGAPSTMPPMSKIAMVGGPSSNPDQERSIGASGLNLVKGAATSAANVSGPTIAHRLLQKSAPNIVPQGDIYPGEVSGHDLPSELVKQGGLMLAGGLDSAPEESAANVGETAAATSPTPDRAASGAESRPISATEATPLLQKVPQASRPLWRDVAGLAHGALHPTSPFGFSDALVSIKNILARHEAGNPIEAEANPNTPTPTSTSMGPGSVTSTSIRTGPAPNTSGNVDWGAKSTRDFQLSTKTSTPSKVPTERIPDWKTNPSQGTPVSSVAPHTQGNLSADDISTMLKKTGPPRGGKGQTGRSILRKNVKDLEAQQ